MWFAELPFLSLQAQSPGGVARAAENNSTTAGNQSMRVVTFKAVPGTARTYYYHRDHLGSTTLITNDSGEVVQRVEYLPTGETFIEQQDTSWVSPHKFNGKELDEETGLYYYGARYYDPRLSLWLGTDPMQGKYPDVSTYCYTMGNPVRLIDPDGRDWYIDIDKTYQYSPNVHSQKDLGKGQTYLWPSRNDTKAGIYYRSDGSMIYKNETAAYNRMWNQADKHYRTTGDRKGREVSAFILNNGNILILPDYANNKNTSKIGEYGYKIKSNGTLLHGKETFAIIAQIHTHQKGSGDPQPSIYGTPNDSDVSEMMGTRPVFVMGHDNHVYGVLSNKDQTALIDDLPTPFGILSNLLHGVKYSFYKYIHDNNGKLK